MMKEKWEEKQLYGYFKWQTIDIAHKKTWFRQGNLIGETNFLIFAA